MKKKKMAKNLTVSVLIKKKTWNHSLVTMYACSIIDLNKSSRDIPMRSIITPFQLVQTELRIKMYDCTFAKITFFHAVPRAITVDAVCYYFTQRYKLGV